MRKRVLFYVRKGNGLGHLRRLSRLAEKLSESYSCLFVSSHREMQWIVPSECEYYYIPFDNPQERSDFILHIHNLYMPDAIVVDHSVNGNEGDIYPLMRESKSAKILVLRGVLDSYSKISEIYLNTSAREIMTKYIDYIFIACDENIASIDNDYYFFNETIKSKMSFIGYVSPNLKKEAVDNIRKQKTKEGAYKYVVSSAGGGFRNQGLFKASLQVAASYPTINWDIFSGPKNENGASHISNIKKDNISILEKSDNIDYLIAASDILITKGGYNNLIEAVSGNTFIICRPTGSIYDEQYVHINRLSKLYDRIMVVNKFGDIKTAFAKLIENDEYEKYIGNSGINLNGAENFYNALKRILG